MVFELFFGFCRMRGAHKAPVPLRVEAGSFHYARFESFSVDEARSRRIALDAISNRRKKPGCFNDLKKDTVG
jgi:hypothetical protein